MDDGWRWCAHYSYGVLGHHFWGDMRAFAGPQRLCSTTYNLWFVKGLSLMPCQLTWLASCCSIATIPCMMLAARLASQTALLTMACETKIVWSWCNSLFLATSMETAPRTSLRWQSDQGWVWVLINWIAGKLGGSAESGGKSAGWSRIATWVELDSHHLTFMVSTWWPDGVFCHMVCLSSVSAVRIHGGMRQMKGGGKVENKSMQTK